MVYLLKNGAAKGHVRSLRAAPDRSLCLRDSHMNTLVSVDRQVSIF
jgi:hypothetical protein